MSDLTINLHLGDCLPLLRTFPTGHFDALITDPPYSSGGMFRGDRMDTTNNKYMNTESAGLLPTFKAITVTSAPGPFGASCGFLNVAAC